VAGSRGRSALAPAALGPSTARRELPSVQRSLRATPQAQLSALWLVVREVQTGAISQKEPLVSTRNDGPVAVPLQQLMSTPRVASRVSSRSFGSPAYCCSTTAEDDHPDVAAAEHGKGCSRNAAEHSDRTTAAAARRTRQGAMETPSVPSVKAKQPAVLLAYDALSPAAMARGAAAPQTRSVRAGEWTAPRGSLA
jgi:hypothetical protein